MICALIEAHNRYEELFSYHEDRYSRYEEPEYEYEGVRAEGYKHNEDPTFLIRFEETVNGDVDYFSDYTDLVDSIQQNMVGVESIDTERDVDTFDGVRLEFGFTEFEVQSESAEWVTPTLLSYGSLHLDSTIDDTVTHFCDRKDLEYFNIRNHFVIRGENITESENRPERFRAQVSDRLDSNDHAGTSSANMNLFLP